MNGLDKLDVREFILKLNEEEMFDYACDQFAMLYGWRWQVFATEARS